jgi:hypothetical protein
MPVQVVYITAVLLLLGVVPLPLEFFNYLNIVAFGTFGWGAYFNIGKRRPWFALLYGVPAILFNPIMEITLAREVWIGIYLVSAILLLLTKRNFAE